MLKPIEGGGGYNHYSTEGLGAVKATSLNLYIFCLTKSIHW